METETLKLKNDVYSMTIAANMTKNVPPAQLTYCLKHCFIVFVVQSMMSFFWVYDFRGLSNFQPFYAPKVSIRILTTLLLQARMYGHLQDSIKLLTFLKR
jgi:hypothetical protein